MREGHKGTLLGSRRQFAEWVGWIGLGLPPLSFLPSLGLSHLYTSVLYTVCLTAHTRSRVEGFIFELHF